MSNTTIINFQIETLGENREFFYCDGTCKYFTHLGMEDDEKHFCKLFRKKLALASALGEVFRCFKCLNGSNF